jgi:hypothetical protein
MQFLSDTNRGGRIAIAAESRRWGIEGERTLCLEVSPDAQSMHVYRTIRSYIPAKSRQGWTRICHKSGACFNSTW